MSVTYNLRIISLLIKYSVSNLTRNHHDSMLLKQWETSHNAQKPSYASRWVPSYMGLCTYAKWKTTHMCNSTFCTAASVFLISYIQGFRNKIGKPKKYQKYIQNKMVSDNSSSQIRLSKMRNR